MCLSHKDITAQTDLPMKRPGFIFLHQELRYPVNDLTFNFSFEQIHSDPEIIQFMFLVLSRGW